MTQYDDPDHDTNQRAWYAMKTSVHNECKAARDARPHVERVVIQAAQIAFLATQAELESLRLAFPNGVPHRIDKAPRHRHVACGLYVAMSRQVNPHQSRCADCRTVSGIGPMVKRRKGPVAAAVNGASDQVDVPSVVALSLVSALELSAHRAAVIAAQCEDVLVFTRRFAEMQAELDALERRLAETQSALTHGSTVGILPPRSHPMEEGTL